MALNPSIGNTIKLDADGYAAAELTAISRLEASESDYGKEQFLFTFSVDGTRKTINLKLWTGVTLSLDKFSFGFGEDYNKLTRLLLNLEAITKEQLVEAHRKGEDIPIDLSDLIGSKMKFKPSKNIRSKELEINLYTISTLGKKEVA